MGFNPPVPQQDSNWEIRVVLLLSLLLQVLLIFLGPLRKRYPLPRTTVWSCYLLADWVADLGLGLILNNMGNIGGGSGGGTASTAGNNNSSPIIFAFWAPFLLLHLGGPDTITAYSLEDNELWPRHLIGLLFELFSACVIFFCSLRGNPLIHATILMFVVGVIKYGERTYSLYCGSLERFRANILGRPDPSRDYAKFMAEFDSKKEAGLDVEIVIPNKNNRSEADSEQVMVTRDKDAAELQAYAFFGIFRRLFVDLILSSKQRMMARSFFLERELKAGEAFEIMELELGFIYDMVYTKGPVAHSWKGCVLRAVCSVCLVSALVIFVHVDKQHKVATVDVSITYVLLLGGLALDLVALAITTGERAFAVGPVLRRRQPTAKRALHRRPATGSRRSSEPTAGLLISDRAAVFFLQKSSPRPPSKWLIRCLNEDVLRWLMEVLRWLEEVLRWLMWPPSKWLRWLKEDVLLLRPRHWSREVSQYNLIGRCVGSLYTSAFIRRQSLGKITYYTKRYTMKVEKKVGEKVEVVKEERVAVVREDEAYLPFPFCFIKRKGISRTAAADIESFVLDMFFGGAKGLALQPVEKQEQVLSCRGKVAIDRLAAEIINKGVTASPRNDEDKKLVLDLILDSVVSKDFDESLLLWHIATDLCMFRNYGAPMLKKTMDMRAIAETLSEYMLYLLIVQPEMLSARSGIWLKRYQDTHAEAERFFGYSRAASRILHEDARRMLLSVNTSKKPMVVKGDDSKSVLFDAVILAKALRELDEEVMWELVSGVWTEMMLYAARSCPGSTHVRHLNRGGQLITIIWLLMEHMGLGDPHDVNKVVDVPAKLIVHHK